MILLTLPINAWLISLRLAGRAMAAPFSLCLQKSGTISIMNGMAFSRMTKDRQNCDRGQRAGWEIGCLREFKWKPEM